MTLAVMPGCFVRVLQNSVNWPLLPFNSATGSNHWHLYKFALLRYFAEKMGIYSARLRMNHALQCESDLCAQRSQAVIVKRCGTIPVKQSASISEKKYGFASSL